MGVVRNEFLWITTVRTLLVFICFFSSFLASSAHSVENRLALVIGNAAYDNLKPLKNPVRDATAISDTLSSLGFRVYLALDLIQSDVVQVTELFARKSKDADVIVIYYAGHGASLQKSAHVFGIDFHIGVDTPINASSLADQFKGHKARKIWIFDSCLDQPKTLTHFLEETRNFETELAPNNFAVFATAQGKAAYDGIGQHSLFTGALLDEMIRPNVNLETIIGSVRAEVFKNSNGQQLPRSRSTLLSEIILYPKANSVLQEAPLPAPKTSLHETGFSQKPILKTFAAGIETPAKNAPFNLKNIRIKAALCRSSSAPRPAGCDRLIADLKRFLSESGEVAN